VIGIEGDGFVVVVRPPARPALEEAVAETRAVLAYLDDLFRTSAKRRAPPSLVVLYVQADRREVVGSMSGAERRRSEEFGIDLDVEEAWHPPGETTAEKKPERPFGFFDTDERVTRVHWPDEERTDRSRRLLARLLVHHWLMARCPRFLESDLAYRKDAGAEWMSGLFIGAVGDGAVDPATRAWTVPPPTSQSAENIVILLDGGLALPWATVFGATMREVDAMDVEWRVGRDGSQASERGAWWAQGTAAIQYLLEADGGAYRSRVADQLAAGWVGQVDRLSVEAAYGMSAETLGSRVEAWARRRAPKKAAPRK
jgi:hypothetical protein